MLLYIVVDVGFIILLLFVVFVFLGIGRYFFVGMFVVFVGVVGGFVVNVMFSIIDVLLVGFIILVV